MAQHTLTLFFPPPLQVLRAPACMHAFWAALSHSINMIELALPLLYQAVKRSLDAGILAAAGGKPQPGSLSALLAQGGAKPLARAMRLVHAAASQVCFLVFVSV